MIDTGGEVVSEDALWKLKVHAFLHDPPEKALVLFEGGHAERGKELATRLVGDAPAGAGEAIKAADHMASAADREALLRGTESLRWIERPVLRHPLAGDEIDLSQWGSLGVEPAVAREEVDRAFARLEADVTTDGTPERKFWALWRFLPEYLAAAEGGAGLGGLWRYLPAETRMPDHSIWDHQRLVSALAPMLWQRQEPTLLLVAFGQVQGFIGTARRTADLWAGSFILSWLASRAIVPLVSVCGPDAVLFPSLWRQPLLDRWLLEGPLHLPLDGAPCVGRAASLPNRFLALVPGDEAKMLAEKCVASIRDEWRRLGRETCAFFAGVSGAGEDRLAEFFDRQLPAHLEAYWATYPWPSDLDQCRAMLRARLGDDLPALETIDMGGVGQYRPSPGALYAEAYRAADLTLGGVKAARLFGSLEEPGLKCSLCGDREVVHPGEGGGFREARDWWRRVASGSPRHAKEGEALCAVCLLKRLASDRMLGPRLFGTAGGDRWGVPSTSEIAAAPFKQAVLRTEAFTKLRGEVERLVRAAKASGLPESETLAPVWRATFDLEAPDNGLAQSFALRDGECFWWGTEDEGPAESRVSREVAEAAGALVRAAEPLGISPPFPYLALLRMDGDDMGRWLGGDRPVKVGQTLHPRTESWLHDRLGASHRLWQEQRRMTPATHAAVSGACGAFALDVVPTLAWDRLAYLIYAGGDDVLALVALDDALELARDARLAFGGHMQMEGGRPVSSFDKGHGFWKAGAKVVMTLGRRAGLSGALVVFHHKYPLQTAVEESRRAEEWAKALRDPDKDALALVVIRRGGQQTRCRLRWTDGERQADAIRDLGLVSDCVRQRLLSPRFHGTLKGLVGRADARSLPGEALQLLAHRAVERHWDEGQAGKEKEPKEEAIEAIWRLRQQAPSDVEWLSALEVAVLLARGGR